MSESGDADVLGAVAEAQARVQETIAFIHAHPELPHQEAQCSGHLIEVLRSLGLSVEVGLAGMDTGFRATLAGPAPGRRVGIVALYDAVASVPPEGGIEAVHSCGHGPIAGAVVGALAALSAHHERLSGSVVVMGCPADEIHAPTTVAYGSGKAISAAAGAWDDIDAALYVHPEYIDTVSQASLWMRRLTARVAGTRSLVVGTAQPPLDASAMALEAIRALPADRAILERLELDGDVEEGGGLVARMTFLLWADDEAGLDALAGRLRASIAADWTIGATVPGIVPNAEVTAAVADAMAAAGRDFVADPPPLPFATDFGAVSRRVPSAFDRHRARGRLGLPHARRRAAVRLRGRCHGRDAHGRGPGAHRTQAHVTSLSVRNAAVIATMLVLAGVLLVVLGTAAAPLSRSCALEMDETGCEEAVVAVMKRGLPAFHPLILSAHVRPGSAPGPQDLGHRATVDFALLGVPGTTAVEFYFDRGAHWGGESDRDEVEIAGWTLAPLVVAGLLAVVILGFGWRRHRAATG